MAPRLNKRQQREQEELLVLASSEPPQTSPSTDRHDLSEEEVVAPSKSGFSAVSLSQRLTSRDRDHETQLFTPEDEPAAAESEDEDVTKPTKSRKVRTTELSV